MSISERFVFSAPVMAMLVLAGCAPSAPPAKERVVEVETLEIAPAQGNDTAPSAAAAVIDEAAAAAKKVDDVKAAADKAITDAGETIEPPSQPPAKAPAPAESPASSAAPPAGPKVASAGKGTTVVAAIAVTA